MNIDKRQQKLVIGAGILIAFWLGDTLIYSPLSGAWTERGKRIADLQTKIERGTGLLERARSVEDRWDGMRTNTLPSDKSAAETLVFNSVEKWRADSGVDFVSQKPQWKEGGDSGDYMTFEYRVDATGTMQSLTKFIYNVESSPLAFKVELVEIGSHDSSGQVLTLGLQLNGLVLNTPQP